MPSRSPSSLLVHPPSPRLSPQPGAPAATAATSQPGAGTGYAAPLLVLDSLPAEFAGDSGIADWRETTPLAHLLAIHRREEGSVREPQPQQYAGDQARFREPQPQQYEYAHYGERAQFRQLEMPGDADGAARMREGDDDERRRRRSSGESQNGEAARETRPRPHGGHPQPGRRRVGG